MIRLHFLERNFTGVKRWQRSAVASYEWATTRSEQVRGFQSATDEAFRTCFGPLGTPHRYGPSRDHVKKFNQLAHVIMPGVEKWRYTFENDWSGDPAIFFWVTLTDEASKPQNLQ